MMRVQPLQEPHYRIDDGVGRFVVHYNGIILELHSHVLVLDVYLGFVCEIGPEGQVLQVLFTYQLGHVKDVVRARAHGVNVL